MGKMVPCPSCEGKMLSQKKSCKKCRSLNDKKRQRGQRGQHKRNRLSIRRDF